MDGGTHNPKNPDRVPPILSAIDQPQEGLPRVIHPVGMIVGRSDPDAAQRGVIHTMSDPNTVKIDEDVTIVDESGTPFQFRKGDAIPMARAAQFPDLAKKVKGEVAGSVEARMVYGAPENRMEPPPPENRGGQTVTSETAAQKKAREKAEKEAADAEAAKAQEDAKSGEGV